MHFLSPPHHRPSEKNFSDGLCRSYNCDKLGQIRTAGAQTFAFDPGHNLTDGGNVQDNRIAEYRGTKFIYDTFGNTVHKEFADGRTQNLYYDVFHQLIKAETFTRNPAGDWTKETWLYDYDALGRRIRKGRLKEGGQVSDGLEDVTEFVWSGSRLVQEVYANGRYTYIYTDQDSYEPLAQIHNHTNEEGETRQEINYFHCDQIGIPREMTDSDGRLLWFGNYYAWGKLKEETNVTGTAHQPFRLQNQYCDRETGLHYNFFRYYDPEVGRFISQDPIGLEGGENFYGFGANIQLWIDPLGLSATTSPGTCNNPCDSDSLGWTSHGGKHVPPPNTSWSKIRKSTKKGPAKYKPEINIESFERAAWSAGTPVPSSGKNVQYRVYDAGEIIGASEGVDTPYARIECSQGVIHGHPITKNEYLKRLKGTI